MVDVDHDRVHLPVLVVLVELHRIIVEIIAVIKAGQVIPLRLLNRLLVFMKLDRALCPGQNDAGIRIRLGNKIVCPELQTLYFGTMVGGRDNNRNTVRFRRFLHLL